MALLVARRKIEVREREFGGQWLGRTAIRL
jgi:hypothetical protein